MADLGRAIARAKGLDAATADAAGRIRLGIVLRRDERQSEIGNARSNAYKGSFQTVLQRIAKGAGSGRRSSQVAALDPAVAARDDKEEARVGKELTSATIAGPPCAMA